MRFAYCQDVSVFRAEVADGSWINRLMTGYLAAFNRNPSTSEIRSWNNSHPALSQVLNDPSLNSCMIMLEAMTSIANNRVDALLLGQDNLGNNNLVVIELKGWASVRPSTQPDEVETILGGSWVSTLHPCYQAEEYVNLIVNSEPACDPTNPSFNIRTNAMAYLHNMNVPSSTPLLAAQFNPVLNDITMYLAGDVMNMKNSLMTMVGGGSASAVLPLISGNSNYISRNLATTAQQYIPNTPLFNLIGRQININRQIQALLQTLAQPQPQKQVIIIQGGPGSGKTAVAIQSLLTAIAGGMTQVAFVARSAGLLLPLRRMLRRTGLTPFMKYPFEFVTPFTNNSGNTYGTPDNDFDFVVVDEAHRLPQQNSRYRTWPIPQQFRSGLTTADEIVRSSRISVFILDERQVISPGNADEATIRAAATTRGANVTTFTLNYQFRSGGSSRYLEWVQSMMYPDAGQRPRFSLQPGTAVEPMRFDIVQDPNQFQTMLQNNLANNRNDARMIAGYCWEWNNPNRGVLPNDIQIVNYQPSQNTPMVNFSSPWENKRNAATWAIRKNAMMEVGSIYTIQGLDFDRVFLIWPHDLQWNPMSNSWSGFPGRVPHSGTPTNPPNTYDNWDRELMNLDQTGIAPYLQNIYNVLLTRANLRLYVYFMHDDTREYFQQWL